MPICAPLHLAVMLLAILGSPCHSWILRSPARLAHTRRQSGGRTSSNRYRAPLTNKVSAHRASPPRRIPVFRRERQLFCSHLESEASSVMNETAARDLETYDCLDESGIESSRSAEEPIRNWQEHRALNVEYTLETLMVPKQHCYAILREPDLQEYLASRLFAQLPLSQPTPKVVRPHNKTHQLVLRNCGANSTVDGTSSSCTKTWLDQHEVQAGPPYTIHLKPGQFTTSHIFSTLGIPTLTSFEQVGHVIHLNLKDHHHPHRHVIGEVLLECLKPSVRTVVNKVGEVQGDYRTYDMEVLAGENSTEVIVNERGASLEFDLSKVYWSSRLSGERQVLMTDILGEAEISSNPIVIADAFCGVGALCVLLAQTNLKDSVGPRVKILANDWNPDAIGALRKNAKRNRVSKFMDIRCGDAYDFLMDLGMSSEQLPHHVIMNYPLEGSSFLTALRWWKTPKRKSEVVPRIHVYTFARRQGDRSASDIALDEVAHQLLPEGSEPTPHRLDYLQSLNCDVRVREVRDVAPGKLVLCVSFRTTSLLLRHVQGDFV